MYRVTANMLIMSLPAAYVHASMRQGRDSIKTFPTSKLLLFTTARTDGMGAWTLDRILRRQDARSSASSHFVVSFEQRLLCSLSPCKVSHAVAGHSGVHLAARPKNTKR